jgi:hypothetical protein
MREAQRTLPPICIPPIPPESPPDPDALLLCPNKGPSYAGSSRRILDLFLPEDDLPRWPKSPPDVPNVFSIESEGELEGEETSEGGVRSV